MYCPQCGVEYRDGFSECSDCQVPLLPGVEPAAVPVDLEPDMESVLILDTNDPFAFGLAKGALTEAGIPFSVMNGITTLMNEVDPSLQKWQGLQVARDCEVQARELLAEILAPQPQLLDDAESPEIN